MRTVLVAGLLSWVVQQAPVRGGWYELSYEPHPAGETQFRVLSPEGSRCEVWQEKRALAEYTIPFQFRPEGGRKYRFVVRLPEGRLFDQSFEARAGQRATLRVRAKAP